MKKCVLLEADVHETPREILAALQAAPRTHGGRRTIEVEVPQEFAGNPDGAMTLTEVLDWHVARHPNRGHTTLLVDDEHSETLTYGQLHERARRAAAALRARGLAPGQTCALMLPTSLEFFVTFCGVLYAGGVPVPLYPPARPSALEDHLKRQAAILANCEAPLLITVPQAKPLAHLIRPLAPTLRHVLTPEELDGEPLAETAMRATTDLALLQYTSGSTGVKDAFAVAGERYTRGMTAYQNSIALQDEETVRLVKAAGAIIWPKPIDLI